VLVHVEGYSAEELGKILEQTRAITIAATKQDAETGDSKRNGDLRTGGGLSPGVLDPSMTTDELCEQAQRLIERGDFQAALLDLEQALQQQPENGRLWLMKGVGLGLAGKHADALVCFERCTELYPQIFTGWYHKGVAFSALGQSAQAIECYRRARRLDPTDASSAFNLGAELCKSGGYREALEQFWDAKTLGHERGAEAHSACRRMIESKEAK
jgi:tetratricopeptide (TPR) repeat protein